MCRDILLRTRTIYQRELEGGNDSRDIMTYLGAYSSHFDIDTLIDRLSRPREDHIESTHGYHQLEFNNELFISWLNSPPEDESEPENYRDLMQKLEQGIDFLVWILLTEFRFNDDELRATLTRILNDPNPANHSDELRTFLEDGDVVDDVIERIEYHHLDINEVVDYALYNLNLRRNHPEQFI